MLRLHWRRPAIRGKIQSRRFSVAHNERDLSGLVPQRSTRTGRRYLFGRCRQCSSRRFLQRHSRTRSRGPFLVVVPVGRCTPRMLRRRVYIAKDDRQTVFAVADDDCFRICGLRKLKRRLDAAPTKVGLRDALADDLLKIANAFCLDLLAFRLSFFALNAKLVFLRNVVLLSFAIDGVNYGRGQLNASHKYVIQDQDGTHRHAVRLFAFFFACVLHHLCGQPLLHETADFILDFLARRRIHLFGGVSSDDLACQTADSRLHQHLLVIWPDRLVQHGHRIALQPKPDDDCCRQAHAVAGDGVVTLRKGLQPQVVQKYSVPGQNEIETLTLKLARVEHSAAAKAFPQDADLAAGNRYHHVRVQHHCHKCRDHQVDHYAREMALKEPPPPRWCPRRGRRPIYWPQIYFHHLFSTVCRATKRSSSKRQPASGRSNSSIKRSWGVIQHTMCWE